MVDIAAEADTEIAACRARIADLEVDARRYRAVRSFGKSLKLYLYDDEEDPFSGDWKYNPSPERIDAAADEWIEKFGDAAMKEST